MTGAVLPQDEASTGQARPVRASPAGSGAPSPTVPRVGGQRRQAGA